MSSKSSTFYDYFNDLCQSIAELLFISLVSGTIVFVSFFPLLKLMIIVVTTLQTCYDLGCITIFMVLTIGSQCLMVIPATIIAFVIYRRISRKYLVRIHSAIVMIIPLVFNFLGTSTWFVIAYLQLTPILSNFL